jgi:hypothetical protein
MHATTTQVIPRDVARLAENEDILRAFPPEPLVIEMMNMHLETADPTTRRLAAIRGGDSLQVCETRPRGAMEVFHVLGRTRRGGDRSCADGVLTCPQRFTGEFGGSFCLITRLRFKADVVRDPQTPPSTEEAFILVRAPR